MDPRETLLRRCRADLLRRGVATLSLRPLARRVGTSPRMLVYHFGSKEGLITAVMDDVRARLQASFRTLADHTATGPGEGPLLEFWRKSIGPEELRGIGLLFEVQVLALRHPRTYARYLDETSSSWLDVIQGVSPASKRSAVLATLYAAVFDGLVLELMSTGDRERTTQALLLFQQLLREGSGTRAHATTRHAATRRRG